MREEREKLVKDMRLICVREDWELPDEVLKITEKEILAIVKAVQVACQDEFWNIKDFRRSLLNANLRILFMEECSRAKVKKEQENDPDS